MSKLILIAILSLLAAPARAATARRAVMENLATTGSSLFVSSAATRVGVGTSTPAVTLDVAGQAQFGSAAAKSTFTTVGALLMASGSSITLSGANGFITGKSSITASAFFGDGSALTGISAGGETNTYASSKTFTTNVLMKASATASGFFGDGSALTGLPVAQTTITYNLGGATTETTNFKVCYGTGTLTFGGTAPVAVFYSGDITNSGAAGTYCIINFLLDGAFISPASSLVGMGKSNNAAAGGSGNAATLRLFPNPGAGSHSYCISLISPFGTTCTFSTGGTYGNQFGVVELK